MMKLLILLVIIAGAFLLGRLSAGVKKYNISEKLPLDESKVIDIEVEDES